MFDLSVIIPAKNEEFLQRTIDSVLSASSDKTEIIVILDGYKPEISKYPRVKIIHNKASIGQRAATNQGVKASKAKYIMKLDAHCSIADGFDEVLMADCEPKWVVLPRMYVLDAFHWVCIDCGKEYHQGPKKTTCEKCGGNNCLGRKIIWKPKRRKRTDYMWFDTNLRVQYFDSNGLGPYVSDTEDINALKIKYSHKKRDWAKGDITDVMCGVGACWFLHRDYYWELGGMDENHGSWGQMAVEIAMKAWLSGGRHVVNKKTWFAHLFRTRPGFSWPYDNPSSAQEKARKYSRDFWLNNKWPGQKHNLEWLIDKFAPLPGWESKSVINKQPNKFLKINNSQNNDRVSIIIPGRCEQYFQQTINSCLDNAKGDIEVIAVIDGYIPAPDLMARDERVKFIHIDKSIGQRAAYNRGVKEATGKYIMKIDAHAKVGPGFDEILKLNCPSKTVVLPQMRRLNVDTWEDSIYSRHPFMYFDQKAQCHYWDDYQNRVDNNSDYPQVMTGQGSCWFTTREWNDYIGLLGEEAGSWGCVGIEVSLRTWLCGGQQIVNNNTWQAHWFRRKEGGFTYPKDGRTVNKTRQYVLDNYFHKDDAFKNQSRPFNWIIDKFGPIPSWEGYAAIKSEATNRVIVYYTDSRIDDNLADAVRKRIKKIASDYNISIISVSQKPISGFGQNICVGEKTYSYRSMYEQILEGVKAAPQGTIINLCEHDVFYHPSHFDFMPTDQNHMFFNTNRFYWQLGLDSFFPARGKQALSQGVAHREFIIQHAEERLKEWEENPKATLHINRMNFKSSRPNVDIRHKGNFTPDGAYKKQFLTGNKEGIKNLPGWGSPPHFMKKVGYYSKIIPIKNNIQYLHEKYNKGSLQPSPVRIPKFNRGDLAKLFNKLGFKKGAEIGVRQGNYSKILCDAIPDLELLCIDPWCAYDGVKTSQEEAENFYEYAKKCLSKFNARLIRAKSMDAVKDIPYNSLDFAYIDGNHFFDFVMMDLIEWSKRVRAGGIVAGHDYYRWRYGGVVPAVDSYTYAHQIHEWFVTDEKETTFFWGKKG